MNRILRFKSTSENGSGIGVHIIRARVSAITGVMVNSSGDAVSGRIGSLMNSLTPSAIG